MAKLVDPYIHDWISDLAKIITNKFEWSSSANKENRMLTIRLKIFIYQFFL